MSRLVTDLDNEGPVAAVLEVDGFIIAIEVRREELLKPFVDSPSIFFESEDCSGTPLLRFFTFLIEDSPVGHLANYQIGFPGKTLFFPTGGIPRTASIRSRQSNGGCAPLEGEFDVVEARPSVDLSVEFSPPFRVQALSNPSGGACCADCDGNNDVAVSELVMGVNDALSGCAPPTRQTPTPSPTISQMRRSVCVQCAACESPMLDAVVFELRGQGITIIGANVQSADNSFVCQACGCPAGQFDYLVSVPEAYVEALRQMGWSITN